MQVELKPYIEECIESLLYTMELSSSMGSGQVQICRVGSMAMDTAYIMNEHEDMYLDLVVWNASKEHLANLPEF